tara:strand:- start:142 stop:1173 length:1032 start_codon:yes stop_codon:yes gene_type:complete
MPISPEKQKQLANEQAGKNSSQEIKEKEKRQADSEQQVSQSLGQINKNVRDSAGSVVLFEGDDGNGLNSPNQYITTKVNTPIYDPGEIDVVVDNVVDELIPVRKAAPTTMSLADRIRNFFLEYEELRDPIWQSNEMDAQDSHVYLVKQSKTYLPIPQVSLRYDGDVVGTEGEAKLKSGNIIELREAVFLPSMVGYQIDLYGLTKNENPVLTVNDIIKTILNKMGKLELGEIDAQKFTNVLRRGLLAKWDTAQVKYKEMGDLETKIKEVLQELYPDLEQSSLESKKVKKKSGDEKKTTAEKAVDKKKRRRKGFGFRRKRGSKYTNARMRVRNRSSKTFNTRRGK